MKTKKFFYSLITILLIVALDQLVKLYISSTLGLFQSVPVIKNIFEITYIHNNGAAWGMFSGRIGILIGITIIVILGCFYIFNNLVEYSEPKYILLRWSIVFLIAGSIGNMIDRIRLGYVVDYLYFKLIDFPIFNIADIFVVISIIIIFFIIVFKLSNDDVDKLTRKSKNNDINANNSK